MPPKSSCVNICADYGLESNHLGESKTRDLCEAIELQKSLVIIDCGTEITTSQKATTDDNGVQGRYMENESKVGGQ